MAIKKFDKTLLHHLIKTTVLDIKCRSLYVNLIRSPYILVCVVFGIPLAILADILIITTEP